NRGQYSKAYHEGPIWFVLGPFDGRPESLRGRDFGAPAFNGFDSSATGWSIVPFRALPRQPLTGYCRLVCPSHARLRTLSFIGAAFQPPRWRPGLCGPMPFSYMRHKAADIASI